MNKVLVVEDNDLNLRLFSDLLKIKNCQVIISKDGINVCDIVQKQKPNLVLMDIQLNGISGIDLIKKLKSNPDTANVPIIVITAFAMKTDQKIISKSGCDLYIAKPVSIDQFFESVNKFININI